MQKKLPSDRRDPVTPKKAGILIPADVYSTYEKIALDERITVAQVIARVAIEFVDVELQASRSRRAALGHYREELLKKAKSRARVR
ncbi:MAG TPA: hypothetical protein VFV34_28390 [Blastocatellia bacterium]|nr:hypothetical protein [Blastocatellia bacterium]